MAFTYTFLDQARERSELVFPIGAVIRVLLFQHSFGFSGLDQTFVK